MFVRVDRSAKEMEIVAESVDLLSKPKAKSELWKYFGLRADEKGQPVENGQAVVRYVDVLLLLEVVTRRI